MKVRHLFFICLCTLWAACEQPLQYRLDEYETQLTVYSSMAVDSLPVIFLVNTQPYYGYAQQISRLEYVAGATVMIRREGLVDTLRPIQREVQIPAYFINGFGSSEDTAVFVEGYEGQHAILSGTTYELEVLHEDQRLQATTITPRPSGNFVTTYEPAYTDQNNFVPPRVVVRRGSDVRDEAYYRARVFFQYPDIEFSFDPDNQTSVEDTVIRDVNRNTVYHLGETWPEGGSFSLELWELGYLFGTLNQEDTLRIEVTVETANEDLGRFNESMLQQRAGESSPLVEPTLLYSNVDGGLGVFGAYALSEVTVLIVELE